MTFLADPFCCLRSGPASVNDPKCAIMCSKEKIVSKLNKDPETRTSPPGMCAGKSIEELIWERLDAVVDRLKKGGGTVGDYEKGEAIGLATALAIISNPYIVNIDAVRGEAVSRWEIANGKEA